MLVEQNRSQLEEENGTPGGKRSSSFYSGAGRSHFGSRPGRGSERSGEAEEGGELRFRTESSEPLRVQFTSGSVETQEENCAHALLENLSGDLGAEDRNDLLDKLDCTQFMLDEMTKKYEVMRSEKDTMDA